MIQLIIYISAAASLTALALSLMLYFRFRVLRDRIREYRDLLKLALEKRFSEALSGRGKLRKRYIVFSIISSERIDKKELEDAIRGCLEKIYGVSGLIKADPQIVYYDPLLRKGVIRVRHTEKDLVISILSLIRSVSKKKVLIVPLKTTGTIKRAKKYMYMVRQD